jgi:fumarylacetoacetate (FAA) hydrolase
VRKARGAQMPPSFWTDPLMYQGGSDRFLGPCDPILAQSEDWGIDLEAEVAVVTDDVPMGVEPDRAAQHIRLVMLVNDVSLRNLIPNELGKGFGFFHTRRTGRGLEREEAEPACHRAHQREPVRRAQRRR